MLWCQKCCFYINLVILWWIFFNEFICCLFSKSFWQNPFFYHHSIHTWLFSLLFFISHKSLFMCRLSNICQFYICSSVFLRARIIYFSLISFIMEYDFLFKQICIFYECMYVLQDIFVRFLCSYVCFFLFYSFNICLNPFSDTKHFYAEYQSCFS